MATTSLHTLPALVLAKLIRQGAISSEELVRCHLERIVDKNPSLSAFVTVFEDAVKVARRNDRERLRHREALPPFHGVPIGIKELNIVRFKRTRFGSRGMPPIVLPTGPADRRATHRRYVPRGGRSLGVVGSRGGDGLASTRPGLESSCPLIAALAAEKPCCCGRNKQQQLVYLFHRPLSGNLPGIVPRGIVSAGTGTGSTEHARDHVAGCRRMMAARTPVAARTESGRGLTTGDFPARSAAVAWAFGSMLGLLFTASAAAAAGFAPSEQVLPATTRAWVSAPDAAALRERFDRSALGKLFDEPLMQTFYDALDEQRSSIAGDRMGFGITPKELSGVSGGESAVAAVEQADGSLAGLLLVDTSGHDDAVPALLDMVFKRLVDRGGKKLAAPEGITAYELPPLPPREGQPVAAEPSVPRRIAYATRPGAIVAGTSAEIVAALLPALSKPRQDSLSSLEAFQVVARKCGETVPPGVATGRWYVDPLALFQAQQKSRPAPKKASKRKPTDYVEMARRNGFDCIKGAGGVVFFGAGNVDLRHNTLIYAPPTVAGGKERYEKAARILEFPNATSLAPASWVPGDAASWLGLQWDLPKVFRALEPLVDDIVGEQGVFDDVISSLKDDPDGPQIDVENDLIRHLGGAVMITGDHVLPFGPDCERMLIALEADDPETVAATIARSMSTEAKTRKIDVGGHVIWETIPDEPGKAARSTRVRARNDSDDDRPRGALGGDPGEAPFPSAAVAVAHGQILIASHLDILQRVLDGKAPPLAEEADYNESVEQLKGLLPGDVALRTFARTQQMVQPTYELLRAGKGPENKSLAGRLANALLTASDNSVAGPGSKKSKEPRTPRVDGTTLPEFDAIRHYFGTAGMTMQTVPEGWMFVGASLWDGGGHDHAPDDTPATEPAVTEPAVTEPEVTEPAVTEKAAAEPAIEQEAPPEPVGVGLE